MTLSQTSKVLLIAGTLAAALGVVLGAFGAHGLTSIIGEIDKNSADIEAIDRHAKRIANWDTASIYLMYHAFGLVISGLIATVASRKICSFSGWFFGAGILLFSGSLYGIALSGQTWLGAIAPLGGSAFILGWVLLTVAIYKTRTSESME